MRNILALAIVAAGLLAFGCASPKAKGAKIPSEMEPNHGMSESRAKGMGKASQFAR